MMSFQVARSAKAAVANLIRRLGYDIVPRNNSSVQRRVVNAHYRGRCFKCFQGDPQCEAILSGAGWDNQFDQILQDASLVDGAAVIEIGANVGGSLVPRARDHARLTFHCVEPVPVFFELLSANVASYMVSNVKLYNVAVSSQAGQSIRIHTQLGTAGAVASYDDHIAMGALDVISTTVDELFYELPVGLIKVDTDGFEEAVLLGARATLAKHHPMLFLEFHPRLMRQAARSPKELAELIRSFGYHRMQIWDNQGTPLTETTSFVTLMQLADSSLYYVDVLFRPR